MRPKIMAGPSITNLERVIVMDALSEDSWYGSRYKYVEKLENEFAKYHGRKHGLMTPNCHQALHLLLMSLDVKKDESILVPDCTWTGSVAPITYCGAKPIFCDIDNNWCLSPESVQSNLSELFQGREYSKPRGMIAVDLYGNMPDMNSLEKIASDNDMFLIEDAAEALGSKYKGKRAGSFGVGSVFSFHSTKTITMGEGGMLLVDDDNIYERAKFLRDCGRAAREPYQIVVPSVKYMPDNLHAALGYAQFTRIEELVAKKREIMNQYKENFSDMEDLQFNQDDDTVYNGAWATSMIIGKSHKIDKETMMNRLESRELPSRPFFYPLSSLPAYEDKSKNKSMKNRNPKAYDISSRGITLPGALILTKGEVDFYSNHLRHILAIASGKRMVTPEQLYEELYHDSPCSGCSG